MTTIVASVTEGVMVCDSRCSSTADPPFEMQKVSYTKEGDLIGCAGDVAHAIHFLEWYNSGRKKRPSVENVRYFCALVLKKDYIEFWDDNYTCMRLENKFFAIGSGSMAALGALYAGADAQKAVEIACIVDKTGSGFPINSYKIKQKRTKK